MQTPAPAFPQTAPETPWYTHIWPWLLMLGPVSVIIAGIYTGWIAYTQSDALVVDDYYKQGKAINQDLRREQMAARLGLHAALRYSPAQDALSGKLMGFTTPVSEIIRVRLVHATQPEKDQTLTIEPDRQGEFTVSLPMLEQSRWQVHIEDIHHQWRLSGTWMWPQQQHITIRIDQ